MNVDDLFLEFLKGRKTFASLCEELAKLATASSTGADSIDKAVLALVNAGRLPIDLAQIIRSSLPRPTLGAANEPEWIDPPTEIKPAVASRTSSDMPVPQASSKLTAPRAGTVRAEVDEVILAALTDGFGAYRRGDPNRAAKRPADERLLDSALESFRGARLRRDAAKASVGDGRVSGVDSEPSTGRVVGIGTILKDRFVLDREIGRGGMGIVYRAVDRRRLEAGHEQPYVAVKLLSGDMRRSPEAFRSLESEARRVQSLAHPNIVTIFDFDRDGQSVFIVMELLQGRPLDAVLAEAGATGLGYEGSRGLIDEITGGLAFAHTYGVIHCDLKPANVFVLDSGAVKILDFGLAIASRGGRFEPALLDGYTVSYASPEILEGAERHPKDDVYALGCLVYNMVSGRRPFGARSAIEARDAGLAVERPDGLPGSSWKALKKALSLSRDTRFEDAGAFRKAYFDTRKLLWFRR